MSFFEELKRRNVIRVGIAYAVIAWLIMQFSDIVLNNIEAPSWVFQVIMLVLSIGLPLALIFAWAFEMTPEGIKKEKDVDRSQSMAPQTGKKLNTTILVLMTLAIAYLLFDKFSAPAQPGSDHFSQQTSSQTTDTNEKSALTPVEAIAQTSNEADSAVSRQSIAVLPFENRSNREEDQFFTDGIHDDLLTTIARIGSMKVISRTSVMEYKGTTKKIPEIALELGVANILEGGIQRSGDHVRINVQLIDAQTDEHLWAEIFDRELTANNLFAIQSEISKAIADALHTTLSPEETQRIDNQPTDNLLALEAYLRGKQLMATRDSEELALAIEAFGKAVELDPDFSLAWTGVADSNNLLSEYGTLPREVSNPIREDAINRALAIDDKLGEAYASLGSLLSDTNRFDEAEAAFQQAIELSPNYATAWHWYSVVLANNFPLRVNEAIDLAEKAAELDPRSSIISNWLGSVYWRRGLFSVAEQQYKKLIELDPGFSQGYRSLAYMNTSALGQFQQALVYALKVKELDPGNIVSLIILLQIYLELDDLAAAESIREQMQELDANHRIVGFADVSINMYKNNNAGAHESINWLLPRISNDLGTMMNAGNVELTLGNTPRAREIYLSAIPGWLDPEQWPDLLGQYQTQGCIFSWILINTGDVELGKQLLQQSTIFLDESLSAVYEHVDLERPELCYLTAGDTEKALESIETQIAHNHLYGWRTSHRLPMYELIRHEPRYQAALAERERRIAAQKAAIDQQHLEAGL